MHAPGELLEELSRAHAHRWTHNEELLALVVEKVDELCIITATAWGDPKKRPARMPTPFRYPRPGKKKRLRRSSLEEIRRFFAG